MKKMISLVLSLAMICCVISVPASAVAKDIPIAPNTADVTRDAGPWFGDVSYDYSIYVPSGSEKQFQARVTAPLMGVFAYLVPSKIVGAVATAGAIVLGSYEDDQTSAHTYYLTIQKRYREIDVGGEFSHYETMIITTFYGDSGRTDYLTSDTQIFEGEMMMRANEDK